MKTTRTRRDMLKGGLAVAGLGVLGMPEWVGLPAYLESTKPANTPRYEKLGFRRLGNFQLPGGTPVARLWREAGAATNI